MTTIGDVEGVWEFVAETPMGQQRCTMSVLADGDHFTGTVKGDFGELEVIDGQIDVGPVLRWAMKLKNPLPLTVKCQAELTGDELKGTISAVGIGSFPVAGGRAS
jgi:hypothetical protein